MSSVAFPHEGTWKGKRIEGKWMDPKTKERMAFVMECVQPSQHHYYGEFETNGRTIHERISLHPSLNGELSGVGINEFGKFSIYGTCQLTTGKVSFVKTYLLETQEEEEDSLPPLDYQTFMEKKQLLNCIRHLFPEWVPMNHLSMEEIRQKVDTCTDEKRKVMLDCLLYPDFSIRVTAIKKKQRTLPYPLAQPSPESKRVDAFDKILQDTDNLIDELESLVHTNNCLELTEK